MPNMKPGKSKSETHLCIFKTTETGILPYLPPPGHIYNGITEQRHMDSYHLNQIPQFQRTRSLKSVVTVVATNKTG